METETPTANSRTSKSRSAAAAAAAAVSLGYQYLALLVAVSLSPAATDAASVGYAGDRFEVDPWLLRLDSLRGARRRPAGAPGAGRQLPLRPGFGPGPGARRHGDLLPLDSSDHYDADLLHVPDYIDSTMGQVDGVATMEFLVDPESWGLPDNIPLFPFDDNALKGMLTPSQRLHLPSISSILPHFISHCSCAENMCSCCAAMEFHKRNQTGCAALVYIPARIAVALKLTFNNRTLIEREFISGSNPPPYCFPIPQLPIFTVCVRMSNISLVSVNNDTKIQVCAAVEAGLSFTSPLIRVRFGCVVAGRHGASWSSQPVQNLLSFPVAQEALSLAQFAEFAAALNSTDRDQLLLLQSLLSTESGQAQPAPASTTQSQRIAESTTL